MKKLLKLIKLTINSIIHPSHISIIFRDIFKKTYHLKSNDEHLSAAINWLIKSQDVSKTNGCSGVYTFENGWTGPYPETTGYIIPTFLNYYRITKKEEYYNRALELGDWEIKHQLPFGAIRGGVGINEYPIVFNTGQVMIGWIALFKETKKTKYLDAARKSAEWLVKNMDDDGCWRKNTYKNTPHSYNIRVTWPLLELGIILNDQNIIDAANKNIDWVLNQVCSNNWIQHMGFDPKKEPLTHTIAYTLRGMLECALLSNETRKLKLISIVHDALINIINNNQFASAKNYLRNFTPGTFDKNWHTSSKYSCLTGSAQLSIIALKLHQQNEDINLFNYADKTIKSIQSVQSLNSKNKAIKGGIAGSYPIWGKYVNFGYPNWATKFFADALILRASFDK